MSLSTILNDRLSPTSWPALAKNGKAPYRTLRWTGTSQCTSQFLHSITVSQCHSVTVYFTVSQCYNVLHSVTVLQCTSQFTSQCHSVLHSATVSQCTVLTHLDLFHLPDSCLTPPSNCWTKWNPTCKSCKTQWRRVWSLWWSNPRLATQR